MGKTTKTKPYTIEFKLGDKVYKSSDNDLIKAVEIIGEKLPPLSLKIKGTFVIKRDGQSTDRFMYPYQLRRLFGNEMNRIMFAKIIKTGLGFDINGNLLVNTKAKRARTKVKKAKVKSK